MRLLRLILGFIIRLRPPSSRSFPVLIAGKRYVIEPLSVGTLRDLTRDGSLMALAGLGTSDPEKIVGAFEAIVRILSAALRPRYPQCDAAWVERNVPCDQTAGLIIAAVLTGSGNDSKAEGDGGGNGRSPRSVSPTPTGATCS